MREPKTTLPPFPTLRPVPAWGRVKTTSTSGADAAFAAGVGLAAVDVIVRIEPAFAGVWRQRLALSATAATARLMGRREDEAALRDAWCFRTGSEDPGPSGHILRIWRQLAQRSTGWPVKTIEDIARAMTIDLEGRAGELATLLDTQAQSGMSPLAAATAASEAVILRLPQAEPLAWVLADLVLATSMRWPRPVPLLMTEINHAILRVGEPRRRPRPGEGGWARTLAAATALAATSAVDRAMDLERRAFTLQKAAPNLRAKGAGRIITALLDDDALTPGSAPGAMSDRALRRLFDRLVELGAVRELSGRSTFRLYGL
jgi:Protein of unknown function (DUF1403)